jgi:thiamine-phosphate pyrophosphorylase
MKRQTPVEQWLIISDQTADEFWRSARRLRSGSGILLLTHVPASERRRLRLFAARRGVALREEGRTAMRVHNVRELRQALHRRTPLILLSPIHPTASHPDWLPLPRMRAAALARLARRRLIALGGMNRKRYAKIARLGFIGWAGISAFRT